VAVLEPRARPAEALSPNALVRWAFYLSVFAIPFTQLYLPGTGERIGVLRLVQVLLVCGVLSQPRVCLRLVPTALFWFLAFCALRILLGLWLSPETSALWWPTTREFLDPLPWLWLVFNVLQFPQARRGGLWALVWGCSLCALFHIAGIGVVEVEKGIEGRTSIFGQNANLIGATYALAVIILVGLGLFQPVKLRNQLLMLLLIIVICVAMAKTGSRTAILTLVMGVLALLFLGKAFGSRLTRAAALVMLGAVVALILWRIPTVVERFDEINPQNLGSHNPRARMAPVLWEMFLRSPIYGSGPDQYQFELTRRAMPYLIQQEKSIAAHNLVLLLLVETGVIGFLIFSVGVGAGVIAAWRARHKPCGSLPLALLLPFVIGGVAVCNPCHFQIFWLALAYALAGAA
jgi:O-antigen ligase